MVIPKPSSENNYNPASEGPANITCRLVEEQTFVLLHICVHTLYDYIFDIYQSASLCL